MLTTCIEKRRLFAFGLLLSLGACSSSLERPEATKIEMPEPAADPEAGVELLSPAPRSQSARQRRVFQEHGGRKVLARVESDFNGDGRIDFVQIYDPRGEWVQIERSDLDGDGRIDVTSIFTKSPNTRETRISEQHFDTNYDGNIDLWKEFDTRGRLVLRKLDRNFDGRADHWEYYENGQVSRIEQDADGDGKPDLSPIPRRTRR